MNPTAPYRLNLVKLAGAEPTDPSWLHLHAHGATHEEHASLVGVYQTTPENYPLTMDLAGLEVRYLLRGQPVSDWQLPAAPFELTEDVIPPGILDGIHDLSLEVRGPGAELWRCVRVFAHVNRHGAVEPTVPIISTDEEMVDAGPGVVYVDVRDRLFIGYPANPAVTPWHTAPAATPGLYQEPMSPHTGLFRSAQMWWEEPAGTANAGLKFVRNLPPKLYRNDDFRVLYEGQDNRVPLPHDQPGYGGLKNFPYKDGPRGVGWASSYIQGCCDSQGGLAFVEIGGPLRYMEPNGELHTVAGWRVQPGKDPVWILKPFTSIRQNMELRGDWSAAGGIQGFTTPMDVAIDPLNEDRWYVASYHDNAVYEIAVDRTTWQGTVTRVSLVNQPTSLVFDRVADCLYVTSQGNEGIYRVDRNGLRSTGIYSPRPLCVRVDSAGRVIVLDEQYADVRRFDLTSGEVLRLGGASLGPNKWGWMDVDRWGNCGPKDGIYLLGSTCTNIEGDPRPTVNECYSWIPPDGGPQQYLLPPPGTGDLSGFGPAGSAHPPHYPWLVAVDPRGSVLLAGIGEHGITRVRLGRAGDPGFTTYEAFGRYLDAYSLPWRYGCAPWAGGFNTLTPDCAGGGLASYTFKHGWDGHNYLGFADAWGVTDATTDAEIIQRFGLTGANVPSLIAFLRVAGGATVGAPTQGSTGVPLPPPVPGVPMTEFCRDTAPDGAIWEIRGQSIFRDNALMPGAGHRLKHTSLKTYVFGTDGNWYRWDSVAWISVGPAEPACVVELPGPGPDPLPVPGGIPEGTRFTVTFTWTGGRWVATL